MYIPLEIFSEQDYTLRQVWKERGENGNFYFSSVSM